MQQNFSIKGIGGGGERRGGEQDHQRFTSNACITVESKSLLKGHLCREY